LLALFAYICYKDAKKEVKVQETKNPYSLNFEMRMINNRTKQVNKNGKDEEDYEVKF
jgi:hypothetical protein